MDVYLYEMSKLEHRLKVNTNVELLTAKKSRSTSTETDK